MQLKDVSAIVTGGASGLGGATAELLAQGGAKVTIFDLAEDVGQAHADQIGARFAKVDVTNEDKVTKAIDEAERENGVARILVNCAGIATAMKTVGRDGRPHAMDVFRKAVEINLVGSFLVLSRFAAKLCAAEPIGEERGVIVNTASAAGYDGQMGQVGYAASKAGVIGMTLPAARDLAEHAIRVMAIAPGLFETPMLSSLPQAAQDSLGKQAPFPSRLGKPAEYAELARAIILNPMLNGEVVRLDGALRMAPR